MIRDNFLLISWSAAHGARKIACGTRAAHKHSGARGAQIHYCGRKALRGNKKWHWHHQFSQEMQYSLQVASHQLLT